MENRREHHRTQETSTYAERRKRADWVTKMATVFSAISWAVAFAVWVVLDMAAPEKAHMFTRMFGVEIRNYWDASLLPIALILLIASLCICILAFIFNMLRKRRKTDKFKKSIFIIGGISILGIVLFVIRFGTMLT